MLCSRWLHRFFLFVAITVQPALAAGGELAPVTDEERALTSVAWHPGAPAVVLFEKGELRLMNYPQDVSSILEVHRRIKILTEEGKHHGEVAIPHSSYHRLRSFEGRTVLPDGRAVPLAEDAIFREERSRARKRFVTKAAFPAVEVGSIIDYRYQIRWDDVAYLEPWQFHDTIPTLRSEITYSKPGNLALEPRAWQTAGAELQTATRKSPYGVDLQVWAENLIAIPDEPYSFPFADLSSRFMVVPKEVRVGGLRHQLLDTWRSACDLLESGEGGYNRFRNGGRRAKKHAMALAQGAASPRERVAAIHAFVRDEIRTEWTGSMAVGSGDADQVLEERQGNRVAKALLLQVMLDAVKVDGRLVWAADRRAGRIDPNLANPSWFESALVSIELGGERVFLDPGDRSLGFGALSPYNEGMPALVHGKKPEIIHLPVTPFDQNTRSAELDLELDREGRISGAGSLVYGGHHAWRSLRWKDDEEATAEAWEEWLGNLYKGYDVSAVKVDEAVEDRRIRVTWALAQRDEELLGDEADLKPSLPLGPVEQLFALAPAHRLTPVQMSFADRDQVAVRLQWPESWEIDVVPQGTEYRGAAGALVAAVEVDDAGRRLTYRRRFDITGREFVGGEAYTAIRNLYAEAESHDAQNVVLVRR